MKLISIMGIIPVFIILLFTPCQGRPNEITYSEINRSCFIIGALGKPLGEILTIEGTVISGDTLREKAMAGKKLLKVTRVDGITLKKAVVLPYSIIPWAKVKEVPVDKTFRYIAYESGGFTGIPFEALKHMPVATTQDYHFSTHLQIIGEAKK